MWVRQDVADGMPKPWRAAERLNLTTRQVRRQSKHGLTLTQEIVRCKSREIRHDVSKRTRRPCHEDE